MVFFCLEYFKGHLDYFGIFLNNKSLYFRTECLKGIKYSKKDKEKSIKISWKKGEKIETKGEKIQKKRKKKLKIKGKNNQKNLMEKLRENQGKIKEKDCGKKSKKWNNLDFYRLLYANNVKL